MNCLILIDDSDETSDENLFSEPTRFKIDVIGVKKSFSFETNNA